MGLGCFRVKRWMQAALNLSQEPVSLHMRFPIVLAVRPHGNSDFPHAPEKRPRDFCFETLHVQGNILWLCPRNLYQTLSLSLGA